MNIFFVPQRRDQEVVYKKQGDSIFVNKEKFNFSKLGEFETLPREAINSEFFCGDVTRDERGLNIYLLLPNPVNYSQAQAFPEPLMDVEDGIVPQPAPEKVAAPPESTLNIEQ